MSERFAETAKRFAPISAQILCWRPDEFWNATPDELVLSLTDPSGVNDSNPVSRTELFNLMERDNNG